MAMATATCGISTSPSRAISLPPGAIPPAQMIVDCTVGMSAGEGRQGAGVASSGWNDGGGGGGGMCCGGAAGGGAGAGGGSARSSAPAGGSPLR